MAETEPGAGNIDIELDGESMALVPSLDACLRISRLAGGLNGAIQQIQALNVDVICEIIAAGLGCNPTQAKAIPPKVYRTGTISLASPCIDFVHVVGRGGRALPEDQDTDEDPPEQPLQ